MRLTKIKFPTGLRPIPYGLEHVNDYAILIIISHMYSRNSMYFYVTDYSRNTFIQLGFKSIQKSKAKDNKMFP